MTDMTNDATETRQNAFVRRLPIIVILCVALLGGYFLRDYLAFDTLRDNREALIAFRDNNYVLMVAMFVATYFVVVAFSLPGATIMTLAGGFLFATFPGALFNVTGATLGAIGIFMAASWGLGEKLAAKMESSGGAVKKIKDGIDENQWSMLFLIRLVPAVPFFVANLVPALVGVPLSRFAISTVLGGSSPARLSIPLSALGLGTCSHVAKPLTLVSYSSRRFYCRSLAFARWPSFRSSLKPCAARKACNP